MNSKEIRQRFLDFFNEKQHQIVASAPMVLKDDPTLMFTNAGMNQFKDIFLGDAAAKHPRVADTQKCLRVSGKHNDLEEVGVDTYHHTMFEMLGNWSFGDYFKKEAIHWAWELLTDVYNINKENLYITIFEGDKADGLEEDTEAKDIWMTIVPKERILACDKKDNFWEMGATGPCGPCSEIHIDIRSDEDKKKTPGVELVNKDHPEVIEIWNLVFMEFNRSESGSLEPLPAKHIDTGMGFERLATVLQNKRSNYDTDIFMPLIKKIESISSENYGKDTKKDIAFRVISDHIRAVAFSIADGQLPSNTGAGYVIRRILRRAIRYAYSFLGSRDPFIYQLVDILSDQLGEAFPEIPAQSSLIKSVIEEEERSFLRTLEKGIQKLKVKMEEVNTVLDGATVFELYDTYGFPEDLTALIARENGMEIDSEGFKTELNKQKDRSREAGKLVTGDWTVLIEDEIQEFIGYDKLSVPVKITRYRKVNHKGKDLYHLIFNITPFYAESGGQVGDKGMISSDKEKVKILDTKKENNINIHIVEELPKDTKALFQAEVYSELRARTMKNHTATHLMHYALRKVLGDHVQQKGSLVDPEYLRFDLSHFAKVSPQELQEVEDMVNEMIRENIPFDENRTVPKEEAMKMGAMALFGEKYGDLVRVVKFGNSVELCGGTHVPATGNIGWFKITSESAVAAGIRRVEAFTGVKAQTFVNDKLNALKEVSALLKTNDLSRSIKDLLDSKQKLQKQIESANKAKAGDLKSDLMKKIENINGVNFLAEQIELDTRSAKDLAFQIKGQTENLFMVLGNSDGDKVGITVVVSEELVESKDLNAGKIVGELAKEIGGGGGGQSHFATAGGKDPSGLPNVLVKARSYLN
ncbi:MAG: alanine--tRNA ligase [Flavobacteriales bacterium]|nr:alanine--tRNA ligase [Flavobacteriales bacterium]